MSTSTRRTVTGRLLFRQAGPPRGLGGFGWQAVLPHGIFPDEKVAEGETTFDGGFSMDLPAFDSDELVRLKLVETVRTYDPDGTPEDELEVVHTIDLQLAPDTTDVGDHYVAWWPYRSDFPTPRTGRVEGKLPEGYSLGFTKVLGLAVAKTGPTLLLLKGMNFFSASRPSMAEIQSHQPKTYTLRVEEETPGRTRSDAWLGDVLLNGFDVALQVGDDREAPGKLRVAIAWGDMPATNVFDLTDVDVQLDASGPEVLPTRIIARVRSPGPGGTWAKDVTHTVTPADGARWEQAKRVVRSQYLLHGALVGHITRCHFQTEMVSVAANRTLRHSPVRHVLLPHLKEIGAQGADGDNFAWGPDGLIATQSALTMAAIHARIRSESANWDWRGFRPRSPRHATHRYAKAARLYWEVLGEYLESYFIGHASAIYTDWQEIRALSEELVSHSLPYEPPPADPKVRVEGCEEADPALTRDTYGGAVRVFSPITHTDTPLPGEFEALQQFCRYVLFHATFNHTWCHDGQYAAGGELAYASIGMRNGSFGAEDDPDVAPLPAQSIEALNVNSMGTLANYGYLMADEEHDVPPELRTTLDTHRAAFARLGVDIDTIRSRINI